MEEIEQSRVQELGTQYVHTIGVEISTVHSEKGNLLQLSAMGYGCFCTISSSFTQISLFDEFISGAFDHSKVEAHKCTYLYH